MLDAAGLDWTEMTWHHLPVASACHDAVLYDSISLPLNTTDVVIRTEKEMSELALRNLEHDEG